MDQNQSFEQHYNQNKKKKQKLIEWFQVNWAANREQGNFHTCTMSCKNVKTYMVYMHVQ